MTQTPGDTGRADIIDALVQMAFTVTAVLSRLAAANDLSLTQFRMLAILRDRTPKMADLAAYLGLDRSTVSGLIDRAALRDLVQRSPSAEDGRSILVGLTDDGRRLADRMTAEVAELLAPMIERLGTAERRRLTGLLVGLLG